MIHLHFTNPKAWTVTGVIQYVLVTVFGSMAALVLEENARDAISETGLNKLWMFPVSRLFNIVGTGWVYPALWLSGSFLAAFWIVRALPDQATISNIRDINRKKACLGAATLAVLGLSVWFYPGTRHGQTIADVAASKSWAPTPPDDAPRKRAAIDKAIEFLDGKFGDDATAIRATAEEVSNFLESNPAAKYWEKASALDGIWQSAMGDVDKIRHDNEQYDDIYSIFLYPNTDGQKRINNFIMGIQGLRTVVVGRGAESSDFVLPMAGITISPQIVALKELADQMDTWRRQTRAALLARRAELASIH